MKRHDAVHICSFDAVPPVNRDTTYEDFKAAVLKAGRFSVFEATVNQRTARMYTDLCRDPEIELDKSCGYPWTIVRKREAR